jgi:hypothetical protein
MSMVRSVCVTRTSGPDRTIAMTTASSRKAIRHDRWVCQTTDRPDRSGNAAAAPRGARCWALPSRLPRTRPLRVTARTPGRR